MTITTQAQYEAAYKQNIIVSQLTSFTSVANTWFSCFTGTLAGANTANGVVPVASDMAFPVRLGQIEPFSGNAYITQAVYYNTGTTARACLFDVLFKAGAYAFNANTTLASQPSYSARIPLQNGSSDYTNTEIWIEAVTAFTGNLTVAVTYTNQSGTTGRTTGTITSGVAPTVRRLFRMPLQSGDEGVQKIESVVSTVATAGTFNVLVLRRLTPVFFSDVLYIDTILRSKQQADVLMLGATEVFSDTCFLMMASGNATSTGTPNFELEVACG